MTIKILGFTQDFNTCDRCGKQELKGTYAIQNEGGEIFYLGSACIAKKFEFTADFVKAEIAAFKASEKNKALIAKYITPVQEANSRFIATYGPITDTTPAWLVDRINNLKAGHADQLAYIAKKYKIKLA